MTDLPLSPLARPQRGAITLRAARRVRLKMEVSVTPAGLVSIGAMVSAILLSSAAIVVAARHRPQ